MYKMNNAFGDVTPYFLVEINYLFWGIFTLLSKKLRQHNPPNRWKISIRPHVMTLQIEVRFMFALFSNNRP